jgi:parvulin-like peptidyl-prolyl isomerase
MNHLLRTSLAAVLALALVATACSDDAGDVATIRGPDDSSTVITQSDLAELYESRSIPIDSAARDTIFALIARVVLTDGLEQDFGVTVDSEEVDELFDEFVGEMQSQGLTPEEFINIPDASEEMMRFNAYLTVLRQEAIDELVALDENIDILMEDPALITTVCALHILTDTEEEAQAVIDRLADGEDFADVADEVSIDTTPGGDLGCSVASRYVTEFADATLEAPLGDVVGPVETQFGFHVIVVNDRSAPTREEIIESPADFITPDDANTLWQQWLNEKLQEAEVEVDPRYGSWSPVGIVPPGEGGSTTTTP